MQIHELNTFSGTPGNNNYLAIDDGTDTGKISGTNLLAPVNTRIDNIISGLTVDAEVIDARLGADGVTYPSLGTAIRTQVSDLKSALDMIDEHYSVNLFNKETATIGYLHDHNAGSLSVSANFAVTDYIPVKAGKSYYQNSAFNTWYAGFYDTSKQYVGFISNTNKLDIAQDGYLRLTLKLADIDTAQVEEGADASRYTSYQNTAADLVARSVTEAGEVYLTDWRRGTINSGNIVNNGYRICNANINSLAYPIVVSIENGYRYVVVYYNEDSGWEADTEWLNGKTFIPANQRFRLLVACDPDSAETININDLTRRIHIKRYEGAFTNDSFNSINRNVLTYGEPIMSINHRGFNTVAPENTLSAFTESKRRGFNAIETDVRWTLDGIPVLLHDASIDRTSDGSGNIAEMTYAQARTYDFGSWKSSEYAGEKIPSVEELLLLAKCINLKIVLEVEPVTNLSNGYIKALVDMVNYYGMNDNVIFASFDVKVLWKIMHYCPYAKLMINVNAEYWAGLFTHYQFLKTPFNVVGFSYEADKITTALINTCTYYKIPYMAWTLNSFEDIVALDAKNLVGVISDSVIASDAYKELYNV